MKYAEEVELPHIFDYLETQLPSEGYLFGEDVTTADISIASYFRNLTFAHYTVDANRWPVTTSFVQRMHALPAFQRLQPLEDAVLTKPVAERVKVWKSLGAPIVEQTLGTRTTPRRGLMDI